MICLYDEDYECPIGDNEDGAYCWQCNHEIKKALEAVAE